MPSVQQLHELWADDSQLPDTLERSLEPRGLDSMRAVTLEPFEPEPAARGGLVRGVRPMRGKLLPTVHAWNCST